MNIEYIKERLKLMKEYLEKPDYEIVGLNSRGFYGIDINDEKGGNLLACTIDTNVVSIIMFKPFACVVRNKITNQLNIEYKFDQLIIVPEDKESEQILNKEDMDFITKMLDFFEEKEKVFFDTQNV